jgi:hypothetical protein
VQIITIVVLATATTAPSAESIRGAVDEVIGRSDLQTELPSGAKRVATEGGSGRLGSGGGGGDIFSGNRGSGGAGGSLLAGIMWAVLIAIGLLIVAWLGQHLALIRTGGGGEVPDADGDAPLPIDPEVVTAPLADAEVLAAQGRYAEAIHTLLLQTLERLIEKGNVSVPESLTSREILARVPLPTSAFAALGDLVGAVEVSHFGPEVPGQVDYERCRDHFHVFAQAYTAGPR